MVGQPLSGRFKDSAYSVRFSRGCGEGAAARGVASRVGGKRCAVFNFLRRQTVTFSSCEVLLGDGLDVGADIAVSQ